MSLSPIKLTKTDRQILDSYCRMLDVLSKYLGDGYEIILHSLENYEHSAIKVINGFHTGRTEGAAVTNTALSILNRIAQSGDDCEGLNYFTKNPNGDPMKSATIPIRGENNRVIGLMCVNFYLNTPLLSFLQGFEPKASEIKASENASVQENFSQNAGDMLEDTVRKVKQEVFADTSVSSSNKNKEIVRRLYVQGLFNLKDTVAVVKEELNLSKNTVYLHLRNLEK